MSKNKKNKEYDNFKQNLETVKSESLKQFDNKIFVFSTGFFALSLILLNLFNLDFKELECIYILYFIWIVNTFVILLNTATHLLMYFLHSKTINEINLDTYSNQKAKKRNRIALTVNIVLLSLMVFIILLYIIFIIINKV